MPVEEGGGPVQVHRHGISVTWPMVATLAAGLAIGGYSAGQQIERMSTSIAGLQGAVANTPSRRDLERVQDRIASVVAALRSFAVKCPAFSSRGRGDMDCTALVNASVGP